jgi:indolepyruvate ferredoxin oxidoreductase alpha subunit
VKNELLLGNHAIARGAWEAGVEFAVGYPGTPSTEILEALTQFPDVHAQWAANEKVAFEEGMGAAIGGVRVLVTMKHVGLNVAADPFMVFPYAGTNAGFVVVSADDPGMHSSQNEQDNRYLARVAKVPVLEPSDCQECKDFVRAGLELSEKFGVPVMLRTTTRLAHHKSLVEVGDRTTVPKR